jgi:PadR family transcriptional regulator PadR
MMMLDNWLSQLRKGVLELAIMLLLRNERRYGLEIIEALEGSVGLAVSEGTIYPLLGRLHSEGLLKAEWVPSTSGHPRKYYTLTVQGEIRLEEMIEHWQRFSKTLNQLVKGSKEAGVRV